MRDKKRFTFSVLAYNHQDFILEHLESVLFLVQSFGKNFDVDLIISDDASTDCTTELIEAWLSKNCEVFRNVIKIYNKSNIGTCNCTINIIEHCNSDYLKITAGDDVYSFENIFEFTSKLSKFDIISGIPLGLIGSSIYLDKIDVLSIIASGVIYQGQKLKNRFKLLNSTNAPNLIYNVHHLKSPEVLGFIREFDVVEDWPIQIKIAEKNNAKFYQDSKVFVYYRRTLGSTYIVSNDRWFNDQVKIFGYLISNESSSFKKVLIRNRCMCFHFKSKWLKKILNLSFYLFILTSLSKCKEIYSKKRGFIIDWDLHKSHYKKVRLSAESYR